jgi:molybdopterin converting factor small subunit
MITVYVQAFGILKDFMGKDEFMWELAAGTTVKEFKKMIKEKYLVHPELPIAVVRENKYQTEDAVFENLDHLFLMPPVSGG